MAKATPPEYVPIEGLPGGVCPLCGKPAVYVGRRWLSPTGTVISDYGMRCSTCEWKAVPLDRLT